MGDLKLASRWERLEAFVIDVVLISVFSSILLLAVPLVLGPIDDDFAKLLDKNFGKAVGLFFYFPFCTAIWGATPGKRILGMKVVSNNGDKLPWYRAILRESFLRWISVIVLGHFWLFFNKKNKTAWDYGVGSVVVKVK